MAVRRKSGLIALCGVTVALEVVCLLLSSVPIASLSLAVFAGILSFPIVIEAGRRAGIGVYVAAALLSLLLVPEMEGKAVFIAFFGYYPVFKAWLEQKRLPRPAEWALKLALFNLSVVAAYALLLTVFHLDPDSFSIGGVSLPWVFLLAGNGIFLLYDLCLTNLVSRYLASWQSRVRRLFHF